MLSRSRSRSAAIFGATVALAGCSLFTDLGGFTSGSDTADAAVAVGPDGGGNVEGGGDGAADARMDGVADGPTVGRFCASLPKHVECVDFDDGALPSSPSWFEVRDGIGSFGVSDARAQSAPFAFRASMPRRAGGSANAFQELKRTFAVLSHTIVAFDFYLVAPAWQSGDVNSGFLLVDLATANGAKDIVFALGEAYSNVALPAGTTISAPAIATNRWVHVVLEFNPAHGSASLSFDAAKYDGSFGVLAPALSGPRTSVAIGIGAFNSPAPAFEAYYDNWTVDFD